MKVLLMYYSNIIQAKSEKNINFKYKIFKTSLSGVILEINIKQIDVRYYYEKCNSLMVLFEPFTFQMDYFDNLTEKVLKTLQQMK